MSSHQKEKPESISSNTHQSQKEDLIRRTSDLHVTHEILVQLEKSKRASENIVYHLPELVFIIDRQGRILKGNKAAEAVLGAQAGNLLFSRISKIFADQSWEHFWDQVELMMKNPDQDAIAEFDLPTDGLNIQVRHFHWNLRKIDGLGQRRGPLLYVVGHDITDIRLMFEEIQESHRQLEDHSKELENLLDTIQQQKIQLVESSKLAQLGEMAGGIAHEINNPITIIKGHAEHLQYILEKKDMEPSLLKRSTTVITNTVARVSAIVNSMRTLARDGSREPFESVDVVSILNDSLVFFREKLKIAGIELKESFTSKSIVIECRGVQLSQVFINLISNAKDAVEEMDQRWIHLAIEDGKESIRILISDSGRPIDPAIADKIMQPFFTTKPVGSGTGLGLSISRAIVNQHGGELNLNTESDHTQFVIELPKKQSPG